MKNSDKRQFCNKKYLKLMKLTENNDVNKYHEEFK